MRSGASCAGPYQIPKNATVRHQRTLCALGIAWRLRGTAGIVAAMRFALVTLALVSLLAGCASAPPPKSQPSPLLGNVMPAFESHSVSGNPVISGGYDGHTLVVSFVNTGNASSESTLKAAQSLYADQRDVVVVSVFREGELSAQVRSLAARLQLRFPVVVDEDGVISRRFQVENLPQTFVVDPRGRVRWVGGAELTEEQLSRAVASVD